MEDSVINFKEYIEDVQDFPIEGITYRDIQPLLGNKSAFKESISELKKLSYFTNVDYVIGIESRGFIFASALAETTYSGFKMIRKAGKLPPNDLVSMEYGLEYGRDTIEMQKGSGNVVLVDDVYATGGTMEAAEQLCKLGGYEILDKLCLVDIGIKKGHDVKCLIKY